MNTRWIVTVTVVSALSGMVWMGGLGWALADYFALQESSPVKPPQQQEQPVRKAQGLTILALGDSLTRGTGDPTGKGYAGHLADSLKERSKEPMALYNFGIKGLRSAQLLEQIQQKEVRRQIQQADVILITIGGNDLFQGGQALVDPQEKSIAEARQNYLQNLDRIFSELRRQNEQASIFLIGLYNPFHQLADAKLTSRIVREWNYASAEVCARYPKTVFVPTFDLFELRVEDYLYSDKFHPNAEGYRLIAERVAALITW